MHKFGDKELSRAAGRILSQGRVNPINWEIRTGVAQLRLRWFQAMFHFGRGTTP